MECTKIRIDLNTGEAVGFFKRERNLFMNSEMLPEFLKEAGFDRVLIGWEGFGWAFSRLTGYWYQIDLRKESIEHKIDGSTLKTIIRERFINADDWDASSNSVPVRIIDV